MSKMKPELNLSYKNIEIGNFYHYPALNKKYYPIIFGFQSIQINKREFHTLKKNSTSFLEFKLLGVFSAGVFVFMFNMAIISCIFVNLWKSNIVEFNYSINIDIIYIYFFSLVLTFLFIILYGFVLKKILLFKSIKNILPVEFVSILSNKIKIKDRLLYIFSLSILKIFLLTSFFVILPNLLYYIYLDCFISPKNWVELVIYIFYISICFNLSNCYINNQKFFSKYNMCNFGYSFILLLLTKTTVIFLMPLLLPFILINNEYTGVNKHIACFEKNILNFFKRLPIVHKLVFIKINNNSFLNSSLVKFRHNNTCLQLNSSNVKYIPIINLSSLTMYSNRANSAIISAIQSTKIISSCLMFTYNDKSDFIVIDRLSVVNIPNINTQILRVDQLGLLPKSGYFNFNKLEINLAIKWKPLEISVYSSNNVLLKNTNCCKPLSDCALVEKRLSEFTVDNKQNISLPTDFSYPWANPDKYNLNIKTNDYMNNICPDLLNPIVYMMSFPNQDPDDNEFNNGNNNKGKGKATDDEIRGWGEQDSAQELVPMEIDTTEQQTLQDQSVRNLVTPEESAQQSNIIDFYNSEPDMWVSELYQIDLSIIYQDLADIAKAMDFFTSTNRSVDVSNLFMKPAALYRIMIEYSIYFDEESENQHNALEALTQVNDYLIHEREAVNRSINKLYRKAAVNKRQQALTFTDPSLGRTWLYEKKNSAWQRLGFSSAAEYESVVDNKYNELCTQYYLDNRQGDINVELMRARARAWVVRDRELKVNAKDYRKKRNLQLQKSRAIDPTYNRDKQRIINNKTLSSQEKQIQLEARSKLRQEIKNKNK